jgi:hypothetical protein
MCKHVLRVSNIITVQTVGAINKLIYEDVEDSYEGDQMEHDPINYTLSDFVRRQTIVLPEFI